MISYKRDKIKSILLYSLIVVILAMLLYFVVWKLFLREIISYALNGKQERDIIEYVKINDVELPFDKNTNTFYYPINVNDVGKEKLLDIEIVSDRDTKYIIEEQEFYDKITLNYVLDFNNVIELYSNSLFYYNKYYIKFTNLPIISISNNSSVVNMDYTYGNISIIDPNYDENESEYNIVSEIKVRTRGSSSANLEKKSYRVRLYENNANKNLSLLGLRDDSDWILDPLYTDDSKIRTKLSYDIWNLINEDVNKENYATLNCEYVEVFMEEEYIGLYLLKEPIDEDSLNLKETSFTNSGILLKGVTHDMIDFSYDKINNISEDIYCSLELKYPKNLHDNSAYWYSILSKMKDYYSGNITDETINNTFYIDNFLNYRLFLLALSAEDNYEPKNVYFSLKDLDENTKVVLTPWDLDFTFGLGWKEDMPRGAELYDEVEKIIELNVENAPEFVTSLKSRWKYLRKNVFNETVIEELINYYYNELTLSDAVDRDYNKWIKADINVELDEIKTWCEKRFKVIDKYIDEL